MLWENLHGQGEGKALFLGGQDVGERCKIRKLALVDKLPVKGQIVNIFGSSGHIISVKNTYNLATVMEKAIDNT